MLTVTVFTEKYKQNLMKQTENNIMNAKNQIFIFNFQVNWYIEINDKIAGQHIAQNISIVMIIPLKSKPCEKP